MATKPVEQATNSRLPAASPADEPEKKKRERKVSMFPILDFQTRIRRLCLKHVVDKVFTAQQMQQALKNVSDEFGMIRQDT